MVIFQSEDALKCVLNTHDTLVERCVLGCLPFHDFLIQYDSFYATYALDGHESDSNEQQILSAYKDRIAPHREIWENVIGRLCSEEDALKEEYIQAGRFGGDEGRRRLKSIYERHFMGRKR